MIQNVVCIIKIYALANFQRFKSQFYGRSVRLRNEKYTVDDIEGKYFFLPSSIMSETLSI